MPNWKYRKDEPPSKLATTLPSTKGSRTYNTMVLLQPPPLKVDRRYYSCTRGIKFKPIFIQIQSTQRIYFIRRSNNCTRWDSVARLLSVGCISDFTLHVKSTCKIRSKRETKNEPWCALTHTSPLSTSTGNTACKQRWWWQSIDRHSSNDDGDGNGNGDVDG